MAKVMPAEKESCINFWIFQKNIFFFWKLLFNYKKGHNDLLPIKQINAFSVEDQGCALRK